jgi:hypothetical protein
MSNIIASVIVFTCFVTFGIWLCDRRWKYTNDLDLGFFLGWIPVAIAIWTALYMVGA